MAFEDSFLGQLVDNYESFAKLERLQFTVKSALADGNAALSKAASHILISELKKGVNVSAYREACQHAGDVLGPEYELDTAWVSSTETKAAAREEQLQNEVLRLQTSMAKELTRAAYLEKGDFYYQRGDLSNALKAFLQARDICSPKTGQEELYLRLMEVSLYMKQYRALRSYASQGLASVSTPSHAHTRSSNSSRGTSTDAVATGSAPAGGIGANSNTSLPTARTNTGDDSSSPQRQQQTQQGAQPSSAASFISKIKIFRALASLADGHYKDAALELCHVDSEVLNKFASVVSAADIALLSTLTSLASLDRPQIKALIASNAPLKPFLALPLLMHISRDMQRGKDVDSDNGVSSGTGSVGSVASGFPSAGSGMASIVNSFLLRDFQGCISRLGDLRSRILLCPYLNPHFDALVQVLSCFSLLLFLSLLSPTRFCGSISQPFPFLHTSPFVSSFHQAIEDRLILSYCKPYETLRLVQMADHMGLTCEDCERRVVLLISAGRLSGHIDSYAKTLHRRHEDDRVSAMANIVDATSQCRFGIVRQINSLALWQDKFGLHGATDDQKTLTGWGAELDWSHGSGSQTDKCGQGASPSASSSSSSCASNAASVTNNGSSSNKSVRKIGDDDDDINLSGRMMSSRSVPNVGITSSGLDEGDSMDVDLVQE
jgi:hypothetical protein